MKKGYLLITLLFLTLLSISCAISSTPAPTPDNTNTLATMVALTVESALGEQPSTPAPSENPTEQAPVEDVPATAILPTAVVNAPPTSPPPVTAPSALTVAYLKYGNVYVWTEGGSVTKLTQSGDATEVHLSEDGQIIAYAREIPAGSFVYELWAVNTSIPTNERLLISHAEMENLKALSPYPSISGMGFSQLAWRPGTHELAYGTVPLFEGPGYAPSEDIRIINVDSMAKFTLFDFGQGGQFSFSPDGSKIVFSTADHISIVNADGSNLHPSVLTFPLVGTYSEYQYHPSPIWAADSTSLRVAIPPEDTLAEPTPPTNLWFIPTDGSPAALLGSIPAIPFDWPDSAFAPDLVRVIYVENVGDLGNNQSRLLVASPDGAGNLVLAMGTNLHFEGWTPNSARFVYSMGDELYLGTLIGASSTITSDYRTLAQMKWVDASRFLYLSQNGSNWELRISDVDGTNHAFIDTLSDRYFGFDFVQ